MPANPDAANGSPRTWARMLGALEELVALHTLAARPRRTTFRARGKQTSRRLDRRAG